MKEAVNNSLPVQSSQIQDNVMIRGYEKRRWRDDEREGKKDQKEEYKVSMVI